MWAARACSVVMAMNNRHVCSQAACDASQWTNHSGWSLCCCNISAFIIQMLWLEEIGIIVSEHITIIYFITLQEIYWVTQKMSQQLQERKAALTRNAYFANPTSRVILNTSHFHAGSDLSAYTSLTERYSNTSAGTDFILYNVMFCVETGIHSSRESESGGPGLFTGLGSSVDAWSGGNFPLVLERTHFSHSCMSSLSQTRCQTLWRRQFCFEGKKKSISVTLLS